MDWCLHQQKQSGDIRGTANTQLLTLERRLKCTTALTAPVATNPLGEAESPRPTPPLLKNKKRSQKKSCTLFLRSLPFSSFLFGFFWVIFDFCSGVILPFPAFHSDRAPTLCFFKTTTNFAPPADLFPVTAN